MSAGICQSALNERRSVVGVVGRSLCLLVGGLLMSGDLSYTPTREMAQGAAQKANAAYAQAREVIGRVEAMEARMSALEAENARLRSLVEAPKALTVIKKRAA